MGSERQADEDRRITILHIEDDLMDRMLLEQAIKKQGLPHQLIYAQDGQEALDLVRGKDRESPLNTPFLILLDLNLPRFDGFHFLKELKTDEKLRRSVIYVLTTSNRLEDMAKCYDFGAAGYITKEDAGRRFENLADLIERLTNTVSLPDPRVLES